MKEIVVDNRTELSDLEAAKLIKTVIKKGRNYNHKRKYGYVKHLEDKGIQYVIFVNKKSSRFLIRGGILGGAGRGRPH